MPIRKILLLVMLGALGLAAAAGAGAILFSSGSGMWQIGLSGILTAVAVGLMFPLTFLVDHKRWRATGLAGMGSVLAGFLAGVGAVWLSGLFSYSSGYSYYRFEDAVYMTPWVVLYHGLFLTIGVAWLGGKGSRYAGMSLVLVAAVSVLLTLGVLWGEAVSDTSGNMRDFAAMVLMGWDVFGLTMTANLMRWGTPERARWTLVGMGASVLGAVVTLVVACIGMGNSGRDMDKFMTGFFVPLAMVGGFAGFANLASLGTLIGGQRAIRWVTVGSAFCTAGLLTLVALMNALDMGYHGPEEEVLARGAGAAAVVAGCGVLALIVTTRLNRKVNADDRNAASGLVEVHLTCPRCQSAQVLAIGKNNCGACGLRINLDIEEPRCPKCEYLLYRLTSNRCPECGEVVAGMGAGVVEVKN